MCIMCYFRYWMSLKRSPVLSSPHRTGYDTKVHVVLVTVRDSGSYVYFYKWIQTLNFALSLYLIYSNIFRMPNPAVN